MKTVARILGFIFIIALLWKDIAAFSWNIWFYKNQVELAAKYCVNKKKPMLHCNGKCYLAKQLKQLEQEEESTPVPKMPLNLKEQIWTVSEMNVAYFEMIAIETQVKSATFHYLSYPLRTYASSIFHPPIRV